MPRSRPSKSRATNVSRAKRRQGAPRSGRSRHSRKRADWSLRRRKLLRSLVARTRKIPWSAKLVTALIEELYVEDEFRALLGDPESCRAGAIPKQSHSHWHCVTAGGPMTSPASWVG